jgi:CheY-like chemotaxis protein
VTILIVDDEQDIRDSLREAFEYAGYKVDVASNGVEAIAELETMNLPSVVILDLAMPYSTGTDVWEHMQRTPRLASIPVIMVTSFPARAPAGVLTIRKPVNLQRLMSAVAKYSPPA